MPIMPQFPLGLVLFPSMVLPLHVFEPRYRVMVQQVLEGDGRFGVVLIREGKEVGDPAQPYEVGTEAQIAQIQRLPDGRSNLVAVGARRFRIVRHEQELPYRIAQVQWLSEDAPALDDVTVLLDEVRVAADEYIEAAYALANQPRKQVALADDPMQLQYQIGALLQIATSERQGLLEAPTVVERLHLELALLRREARMLQMSLVRREMGQANRFSPN